MPDKLTDKEIVKAFEVLDSWQQVALQNDDGSDIESPKLYEAIEVVRKQINRLQAENERLFLENQKFLSVMLWGNKKNKKNFLKQIKTKAYKECIEKVKDIMRKYCGEITEDDLDNLLKELVGEDNES